MYTFKWFIIDSSGAISFGNENLTTTGTMNSATGSTIGNLTLANGSITDSQVRISFGNENLNNNRHDDSWHSNNGGWFNHRFKWCNQFRQ